jgi:recombination protein RecR
MVDLARALDEARKEVTFCTICGGLTDSDDDPCRICEDTSRDHKTICVTETVDVIENMENTGFRGAYHVLGGLVSPLDNIGPEDLRIEELRQRIEKGAVDEIILVLSPTSSGDATAGCIAELLKDSGAKISRIATGLPVGSTPSLADSSTLTRAMKGRVRIDEPPDTEQIRNPNTEILNKL